MTNSRFIIATALVILVAIPASAQKKDKDAEITALRQEVENLRNTTDSLSDAVNSLISIIEENNRILTENAKAQTENAKIQADNAAALTSEMTKLSSTIRENSRADKTFGDFHKGIASVRSATNGLFGLVNSKNEIVLPMEYENVYHLEHGGWMICKEGKWFPANAAGTIISTLGFNGFGEDFDESGRYVAIYDDGKYGVFDMTEGRIAVACNYLELQRISNHNTAIVQSVAQKYGVVNVTTGKEIVACKYDSKPESYETKSKTLYQGDVVYDQDGNVFINGVISDWERHMRAFRVVFPRENANGFTNENGKVIAKRSDGKFDTEYYSDKLGKYFMRFCDDDYDTYYYDMSGNRYSSSQIE